MKKPGKPRHKQDNSLLKSHSLSFEDWLEYFRVDMPDIDWFSDSATLLARLSQLMRSSDYLVQKYTHEEINKLLWMLLGESGFFQVLYDDQLPLEGRLDCISAIGDLYGNLFFNHCSRFLSSGATEIPSDVSALNSICYMWWDIFAASPQSDAPSQKKIEQSIINLLEALLNIDHIAIQESAVHGLGHAHYRSPAQVETILDGFLEAKQTIAPEALLTYAKAARTGCIQ